MENETEYTDRAILKKFKNKKVGMIGRYSMSMETYSHKTKAIIKRYLFKDVKIKGLDGVLLDHIWIPESGHISNYEKKCELNKFDIFEFKGIIQNYATYKKIDDISEQFLHEKKNSSPQESRLRTSQKAEKVQDVED